MRFFQALLEGYRVDVVVSLYEHRGAKAALGQIETWEGIGKEPNLQLPSLLFCLYKMKSYLDLSMVGDADNLARSAILDRIPRVTKSDDREFLFLLFELHFCNSCEEPEWMTLQTRKRSWNDNKLSNFLRKRVIVTVEKATDI